jgi:predicted dithiol-disulfide oxidoreductase (DUF899 family)
VEVTFPNETDEYRQARERLLEREIELRRLMEAVAEERRALPPGGEVPEDYEFQEMGADDTPSDVRMSELFRPGRDALVIYSFMFPRDARDDRPGPTEGETAKLPLKEGPCPSCVAMIDQLEGAADHVNQNATLVVVAKTPIERLAAFARERGWTRLRYLSSANNTYNRDYHAEGPQGGQMPTLNVFERDGETIRHFWATELMWAPADPGQHPRHVGTIEPAWNILDLTRGGRPDWDEQLSYED